MARLWPVVLVLSLSAACVSAGDLQQAAGEARPTVLAAKQNNNIPQQGSTSSVNAQRAISNTNTGAVTATTIQPQSSERHTLDQVNANAPTITDPSTRVSVRPVASSQVVGQSAAAPAGAATGSSTSAQTAAGTGAGASLSAQPEASTKVGVVNPYDVVGANPLDREVIKGDFISQVVGVRIATPFFGTGFNFCIDRYVGSFPKIGIVIPNPIVWLLPEFQDLAASITTTLSLPNLLPHGAFVTPTSDGFLLNLPTFQPSQIPDLGVRYGIQIGQAFGYDFGYGIIKDICFVDFVIV
ncbi:g2364 [Coccomyxa elongata]